MSDVVVVGGGIAGLAAADRLTQAGVGVMLLDAADRLGGKVETTSFAGRPLDIGAETLVTIDATARGLCRELSLSGDLVTPTSGRAFVWARRGLRPLPTGALTRMPGAPVELVRSRLLSPLSVLRCGWDLIAPSAAPDGDVAIGVIVRSRLGRHVLEQIVDPLLGGIHGGRCDTLSAQALAPQLIDALETRKGLARGLRAAGPTAAGPTFATLRNGLGSLTAALATRTRDAGAKVRLGVPTIAVHAPRPGRVIVAQGDGDAVEAAACVVATPADAAARMLRDAVPVSAGELAAIDHAPAAVVALAYPVEALAHLPTGTGFVTAGDERLVRACTWSSAKWPHLGGHPAIVKAFVGRAGARRGPLWATASSRQPFIASSSAPWECVSRRWTCESSALLPRSPSMSSAIGRALTALRRRCRPISLSRARRTAVPGLPPACAPDTRPPTASLVISGRASTP